MTHHTEMRSIFVTFHSAMTTSKLKKYKFFRFINPKTDQNLFPDNTIVEYTIAATAEQKKNQYTNVLRYHNNSSPSCVSKTPILLKESHIIIITPFSRNKLFSLFLYVCKYIYISRVVKYVSRLWGMKSVGLGASWFFKVKFPYK